MARNRSRKIYISCKGRLYSFLSYQLEDTDGSFYITLQRDGTNNEFSQYSLDVQLVQKRSLPTPREKRKKISYHSSGCVRYHNTSHEATYFQPLSQITNTNAFAAYIIPSINHLDLFEGKATEEDFVIDLANENEQIQFNFFLAPWNAEITSHHVAVRYESLFCFALEILKPQTHIPSDLKDHFHFIAPNKGLYDQQIIDNDQALVSFHQLLQGVRDLILYSPNMAGIYKIICAVPMRVAPDVRLKFLNEGYTGEIISRSKSAIKFKVKDEHNHTVKHEVPIIEILLDAEL